MTVTRRLPASLSLLCLGALVGSCSDATQTAAPTTEELVEEHVVAFVERWNARDAEALSMLFAEDGVRVVSSEQLPASGRAEIQKQLEGAMAADSTLANTTLTATVEATRDLPDNLALADGTFAVRDGEGEVVLKGKWGNLLRLKDGKVQLVLESAHAEIGLDADRSGYATAERATPPEPRKGNADEILPAFQRSADRYNEAFGKQDAELLTAEFTLGAVRLVSSGSEPARGKDAIYKAAETEFVKGSPFEDTTLSITRLGLQKVSTNILIANGLWEAKDQEGVVVQFGQWGNVMEIQDDGEMLFVMESAGGFAIPGTSEGE